MSTPKTISSLRNRGMLLLGGALFLALPLLGTASCVGTGDSTDSNAETERSASSDEDALSSIQKHPHKAVCSEAAPGFAHCHARIRTDAEGNAVANATPQGLTPANIQAAYTIPAGGGAGLTVAIVDAYNDPNAESDLAVYRAQFGLPPCTTANGCFKKVSQTGSTTSLPTNDSGWAGEIALDLDMVSAACPSCKILLVEATSSSMANLGTAVNRAALMGAVAISNSYGGSEDSTSLSADSAYFNHPGIAITVSSGDNGYGVEYPASSAHVIAVGGTSLVKSAAARGWTEGAWGSAGSGCSTKIAKPSFQKDTGCAKRMVADISAVADPNTGVAVYNTYGGAAAGATGWAVYGGTSASAPIVASILAATGKASVDNSWPYAHTGAFYDVITGSNGSCSGKYLCTSMAGYDGPTGLGTPNGALIASGGGSGGSGGATSGSTTSSTTGSSTSTTTTTSTTSGGGSTCSHNICVTGTKLTKSCDACATTICNSDSYCCTTKWDSQCVGEVASFCGESCN
jgi:hypothetical protein